MSQPNNNQPWYSRKYNEYYNSYVPWLEDKYLAWFGENKTSYTAKDTLKTDVGGSTLGVKSLQDGVADTVGGQFGKGGLLGGVGQGVSDHGFTRAERDGGKPADLADKEQGRVKGWGETVTGGMLGGGSGEEGKKK